MTATRKKRIGFLVFDRMQALDLFGPLEVFEEANRSASTKSFEYETIIVSENGANVTTVSRVEIGVHTSMADCPSLHSLIIPGGGGSREEMISQEVIDWISAQAKQAERIASVCTGLFILARTGILDGCAVTTHWHYVDEAKVSFPDLQFDPNALFIRNGNIITAAGVTSGIDMALALVGEDMGSDIASKVARELVVFLRRPGGQDQYSSLLRRQTTSNDKFSNMLVWIADNLTEDLSSEVLAARASLSERHFRRAFKSALSETPAQAIERIRIDVAKEWLATSGISIAAVSQNVGFHSSDSFRRAFERLVGVTPSAYRQRFGSVEIISPSKRKPQ